MSMNYEDTYDQYWSHYDSSKNKKKYGASGSNKVEDKFFNRFKSGAGVKGHINASIALIGDTLGVGIGYTDKTIKKPLKAIADQELKIKKELDWYGNFFNKTYAGKGIKAATKYGTAGLAAGLGIGIFSSNSDDSSKKTGVYNGK